MTAIKTRRLTLIPLSQQQLELCLSDLPTLSRELAVSIADTVVDEPAQRAIKLKLEKMARAIPPRHPWYTYWLIVINEQQCGAGLVGFKGYPNEQGQVEIGYGLDPAFRNHGYMSEAVQAITEWALAAPECISMIVAEVHKTNLASIRVIQKAGMAIYHETDNSLYWRITKAMPNKKPASENTGLTEANFS